MPSSHPTARPLFSLTLLAMSWALMVGPAQAAERHWTFIGGCGSADWFGKTNGLNAEGQSNCWGTSAAGGSGLALPTLNDHVFIRHASASQDLVNTFSNAHIGASRPAFASHLSIAGTAGKFAALSVARDSLQIASTLSVGDGGLGKFTQTGGSVTSRIVRLGGEQNAIGRYELGGGSLNITGGGWEPGLHVGASGHGEFVQTGGSVNAHIVAVYELGQVGSSAASSFYEMSGGTAILTGGFAVGIGHEGSPLAGGRARISGSAAMTASTVAVHDSGRLFIEGGTLAVQEFKVAPDSLIFNGGTVQFNGNASFKGWNDTAATLAFGGGLGPGNPTVRLANNATLAVSQLHVGDFGKGRLEVGAGAVLTTGAASLSAGKPTVFIGSFAGDVSATVAGQGAEWRNTGRLDIGVKGIAALEIRSGGAVTSAVAYVGNTVNPDVTLDRNLVLIDGAGSRWQNSTDLVIGGGDTSTGQASDLQLSNGGALVNGGTLTLLPGSTITLQGGSLSSVRTVSHGSIFSTGRPNAWTGELKLAHGSRLSADASFTVRGAVTVAAGAHIENFNVMSFQGPVSLIGGALLTGGGEKIFAGGLSVGGDAPGLVEDLSPEARITLAATNTYFAQIGGVGPGSFDRYVVADPLTVFSLGGVLKLVSINGYSGQPGARFDLFDGSLTGSFASIDTSDFALAPGLAWDFSQLGSTGVLGITAVPEPGTWALWLGGLAVLGGLARRRQPRA